MLKLSSKLSVEEQQLFEGGHMSMQHMDQWWKGAAPNQDQQVRGRRYFGCSWDVMGALVSCFSPKYLKTACA